MHCNSRFFKENKKKIKEFLKIGVDFFVFIAYNTDIRFKEFGGTNMKKFDLYEELLTNGFAAVKDEYSEKYHLTKAYEKEVELCWYGKQKVHFDVEVYFNADHSCVRAYYYNQSCTPFKIKSHLNDKRAFNAIKATVENNGYVF